MKNIIHLLYTQIMEKISIKNLHTSVEEKQILHGIDIDLTLGKNYCLLGKNGSGKSSLSAAIVGNPKYDIDS